MFDNLIDAIFPPRCAVCDEVLPVGRKGICDFCRGRLSYITEPRCLKCGKEIDSENDEYCFDCSQNIRSYDLGFPVFNYIPPNTMAEKNMLHFTAEKLPEDLRMNSETYA